MYPIGSQVMHPSHGAGVIRGIRAKRIGGAERRYYVIEMPFAIRPTQIMIPVRRADEAGLRPVGRAGHLRGILSRCAEDPGCEEFERDFRARQAQESVQVKSGSFGVVADLVQSLAALQAERGLGLTERRLLDQGVKLLAGELSLAADVEIEDATSEVEISLGLAGEDDAADADPATEGPGEEKI